MDANPAFTQYELTGELARLCLPAAHRDPTRKLAWVNSICILFFVIGLFGLKLARALIKPVPPIEEIAPVILQPAPPPPKTVTVTQNQDQPDQPSADAPQAVVVVPNSPSISFSVPTIGTLLAPSALAQAPPLHPMRRPVPVNRLAQLGNTGASGARPEPPYPRIALEQAEQGTVTLLMKADPEGNVTSIQIKHSSGFALLDRATVDFVRRRWRLPAGSSSNQLFQTSITYRLQAY